MASGGPRAGVLGLGLIGSRVAARLLTAGFPLAVWNRTPRDLAPLPPLHSTPADVARAVDVLQIFVSDDAALGETVRAILPALESRHIVMSHSTVSPNTVRELGAEVGRTGAAFLDAPFTGSRDAAASGKLTYYVAGDPRILEKARPVLDASATSLLHVGDVVGHASTLKIATNVISAAAVASLAEAVNLLASNGLDPAILAPALGTNAARSGVTDLKLPCMLQGDFAPRFSARNMLKDMRLASLLAEPAQARLISCLLEETCAAGLADADFSAIVGTVRQKAPSEP